MPLYWVVHKVNRQQLETQVAAHNQALDDDSVTGGVTAVNGELLRRQTVDGKAVRGANQHGRALHLVSLARHESGCVLSQRAVASKSKAHYVRDETMGEDHGQTHTGNVPQTLATLRNAVSNLLRHRGWNNIAAALRHYGASVQQTLQLIGCPAT